jgi:DNA-binding beta-propeller fold protein YncE
VFYVTGYDPNAVIGSDGPGAGTLSVINEANNTVTTPFMFEGVTTGVAAGPVTGKIYVTNYDDDTVSVIG